MISNSAELLALKALRQWVRAEVCRIYLPEESTPIRLSTADYTISAPSAETFSPGFPLLARGDIVKQAGLGVQNLELRITPRATDLIYGRTWKTCLRDGIFDGARVEYLFAFSPGDTPGDCSAGLELQFVGEVADAYPRGLDMILNCEDPLRRLDAPHPVAVYSTQCTNTFCDALCGLSKATYTASKTVGTGPTITTIPMTSAVAAGGYDLGQIRFTSGPCWGIRRMIRSWDGTALTLASALPRVPTAGDTFEVTRGCVKSYEACGEYSNTAKFRGFPRVPKAETAI
jgi:uncharacterized phage protein (TIGR02218 family)